MITAVQKAESHPGVGIVMDSKQNVFYTDLQHVWMIEAKTGTKSIAVKDVHTHELYIDEADNLFGEHLWYEGDATQKWGHYVWRRDAAGKINKVRPDKEGFLSDYSFVRYNQQMFEADRTGKCQRLKIIEKGVSRFLSDYCFEDIRWMTVSLAGNIYLVDKTSVKKVTQSGKVETLSEDVTDSGESQSTVRHMVMGLWTDKKENVYVAIFGGGMVKKIAPDRKVAVVMQTDIRWSPTGGMIASNGDMWLLEASPMNQVRVEKISPDGTRRVYP